METLKYISYQSSHQRNFLNHEAKKEKTTVALEISLIKLELSLNFD